MTYRLYATSWKSPELPEDDWLEPVVSLAGSRVCSESQPGAKTLARAGDRNEGRICWGSVFRVQRFRPWNGGHGKVLKQETRWSRLAGLAAPWRSLADHRVSNMTHTLSSLKLCRVTRVEN